MTERNKYFEIYHRLPGGRLARNALANTAPKPVRSLAKYAMPTSASSVFMAMNGRLEAAKFVSQFSAIDSDEYIGTQLCAVVGIDRAHAQDVVSKINRNNEYLAQRIGERSIEATGTLVDVSTGEPTFTGILEGNISVCPGRNCVTPTMRVEREGIQCLVQYSTIEWTELCKVLAWDVVNAKSRKKPELDVFLSFVPEPKPAQLAYMATGNAMRRTQADWPGAAKVLRTGHTNVLRQYDQQPIKDLRPPVIQRQEELPTIDEVLDRLSYKEKPLTSGPRRAARALLHLYKPFGLTLEVTLKDQLKAVNQWLQEKSLSKVELGTLKTARRALRERRRVLN